MVLAPVPMKANPYDGRNYKEKDKIKPLHITEPEGTNYKLTGHTIDWHN